MVDDPQRSLAQWKALETRLGWTFRDPNLLRIAMTHSTYANEHREIQSNYERMEFLGDAVLDLIAARLLYQTFPNATEGELSQRRAQVVRRESLAVMAGELGLEYCILLGEGQRRAGGEVSRRILADAYESLAGAIFLDGGYDIAEKCFSADLKRTIQRTTDSFDFKTQLQELCHLQGFGQPIYTVVSTDGPDHARVFSCDVSVDGVVIGTGVAPSKKSAEQICARIGSDVLSQSEPSEISA